MKIVVTGSVANDYLMSFPGKISEQFIDGATDHVSLSFLVDSMTRQKGGSGANIAYTLGLLGGNPTLMAAVGQDFGEYKSWLERNGVDLSATVIKEGVYVASFFCTTGTDQNQIASFYPGAMAHAGELTIAEYAPDANLVIVSPNEPTAMVNVPQECRAKGIDFIYDPSQQTIRFTGEQLLAGLEGCRILATNEYERDLIIDKTGLSEDELLGMVGGWLLTLAEKGSLLRIDGEEHHIPAVKPKQVVEPTGAGDAYRGGLMRGMQLGLPWSVSGRMGALAATYVLEHLGPQNHTYTPAEFVTRYREHFDDEGALDKLL